MGSLRPNRIAAGLAALIAIACLFAEAAANDGDMTVVTLRPGVNEIGWISAPMPIERLYGEIPELETVLHWDRRSSEWVELRRRPGRDAPFMAVAHGVSLRLVIGGGEPVEWERPIRPVRGTIQLKTGVNFVPWGGRSGTPTWDALRGVGRSLVGAARWNAEFQTWEPLPVTAPDEGDAEAPTLDRGDALWVAVMRNVNWLQPTYEPPTLVFGSRVSAEDRARARGNLDFVMRFSAEHYGIQAEFSDLKIFIPHDVASLYRMTHSAGLYYRWSTVERFLNVGAWGGHSLMFSAAHSVYSIAEHPTDTTWLHEYVHAIQWDLAGSPANAAAVPDWLIEGTAMHSNGDQLVATGSQTWEDVRSFRESVVYDRDLRDLATFEKCVQCGEHWIGWLAADHLAARAGRESLIEFWRLLPPQGAGRVPGSPEVRWRWAFEDAFGLSPGTFYAEFRVWIADLYSRLSEEQTVVAGPKSDPDAPTLSGMIIRAPDVAAPISISGQLLNGGGVSGMVATDGSFSIKTELFMPHLLAVEFTGDCWMYVREDGLVADRGDSEIFPATDGDFEGIIITIPPEACQSTISGRVIAPPGVSIGRVAIHNREVKFDEHGQYVQIVSRKMEHDEDGRFGHVLQLPGEYGIEVWLDNGCWAYYGSNGATLGHRHAAPIVVRDREKVEIELHMPVELCPYHFRGSVIAAEGSALPLPRQADVCSVRGCSGRVDLAADGRFEIVTGHLGPYRIHFDFGELCSALFDGDKLIFYRKFIIAPEILTLEPGDGIEVRLPTALPDHCSLDPQPRQDG